ncbi:rod shape-determining protein RodA [Jatrophihabitans telluris]|uniref:peptidoglycan glycosyltransferase n=1 Tax=Jatrophihabitans telluris TaxID=2038343 RepID=A0ABY4R176_9ACTN|nr:rod shape-determining protein RodA [Jatrophihabitans telluris]UQX89673.1 rod shape-determining protein RodA [Jatrophihabitans telluris]
MTAPARIPVRGGGGPYGSVRSLSDPRGLRRYDLFLLVAVGLLCLTGALLVWSATRHQLLAAGGNPQTYLAKHLLNTALGAMLLFLAARVDSRLLRLFGPLLYAASVLGLLAVFVIGSTINGAHAWIVIGGGFEIQPAEFAKLGLVAALAVLFGQRLGDGRQAGPPSGRQLAAALMLSALPLGLIMLQPDLGSALVVSAASFGVLISAGVRARWLVLLLVLGVVAAVVAIKAGVLADYQLQRFAAFTNPSRDPQGAAYNINQAHIAIAHGGWFGQGLFHGAQTRGSFVPEQQTDFVFSVAGEELGFLGSAAILGLFAVVLWRGTRIALAATGSSRYLAAGIVCWIAFQTFENVGMNLGLTPVTGLPLPFISYGGSSMFAQGLAIGLLQAIHRRSSARGF